jgi:hypothetical protein
VNDPGHLLDGRLGGYCQGLVLWVPQASGYDPTNLDTTLFPAMANGWRTKYIVLDMVPPLLVEGEGPPT